MNRDAVLSITEAPFIITEHHRVSILKCYASKTPYIFRVKPDDNLYWREVTHSVPGCTYMYRLHFQYEHLE